MGDLKRENLLPSGFWLTVAVPEKSQFPGA